MKRKISTFLFGLLFLIGFGILIYPTVSNQWNTYRQNQLISSYEDKVQDLTEEDFTSEWEKSKAFNATLTQNNLYGDVFGEDDGNLKNTEYWKVLNVADDGVMGYLSIPKINIKLAIYHGTSDKDLQTGVGHLNGSKLPIGGERAHTAFLPHTVDFQAQNFLPISTSSKPVINFTSMYWMKSLPTRWIRFFRW